MNKKKIHNTKRSNGDGSIYQRKDGLWCGCITIGYDDNGKQKKKYIYSNSKTEVAAKLTELSGRIRSTSYLNIENKTIDELMMEWLMTFKKNSITSRTFESTIRNYKLHIKPIIGNMKIYDLKPIDIQRTINIMLDSGYSLSYTKQAKFTLNQFCDYAVDNNWIVANPTIRIKIRSKDKNSILNTHYKALTPIQREKFITALNDDPANFIKTLCYVMIFAGLRAGEAIALQWRNIDFERKTIKIDQAIKLESKFNEQGETIKRTTVIGTTKTACSVREIPATDIVLSELKRWKEQQYFHSIDINNDLTAPDSFVFANDDGSVRTYSGCRIIFDRFIKRNNLKDLKIHFHGLRHTFSNMLFELNENPKVIQQLLGHRDVKTTISVYNNVNSEYIRASTNKLNDKLNENEMLRIKKLEDKKQMQEQENNIKKLTDEEVDNFLEKLLMERKKRQQK